MSSVQAAPAKASTVRPLRVETLHNLDSFLRLKTHWDALIASAAIEHPFVTHDWIRAWWECFGENRTLHIVVVREGSEVVGIAPLLEETDLVSGFRLRKLAFIWNTHVPRCDFIVKGGRQEIYNAIWDQLLVESARWDLLLLPQLPEGSPTLSRLSELASSSGFRVGMTTSDASPYLTISGTWEEFLDGLPRKHQSKMKNRTAGLQRLGALELERTDTDGQGLTLDEDLPLEIAAWRDTNGETLLCDARTRKFYSTLARTPGIRDSVHLRYLLSGGTRIAFALSIAHANAVYFIRGGYLPTYAAYSPFTLLSSMNIEECFQQGIRRYDFLGKEEHWKSQWSRSALSHHWLFVYPNKPQTALFHAMKFRLLPMIPDSQEMAVAA